MKVGEWDGAFSLKVREKKKKKKNRKNPNEDKPYFDMRLFFLQFCFGRTYLSFIKPTS